jgi:putative transposase
MDAPLRSNHNVTYVCTFLVVFCPKYRRKVLVPPVDARLKEIVREQCAALRQDLLAVEVLPDHVHVLVGCDPQVGIHRLVKQIKGVSSRLLRQEYPALKRRLPTLWTNSYCVATTGGAPLAYVKQYVESQKRR